MRPRIAISCGYYEDEERRIRPSVTYATSLWSAGGTPFYMPAAWRDDEWVDEILAVADGVLLTGGGDVHASYYGEKESIPLQRTSELRDGVEARLMHAAGEAGMPVLGICRGCQVVNVAFGGTLIQDVPSMRPSDVPHSLDPGSDKEHEPVHEVALVPGSRLAAAYGTERVRVNSMHHQAVDEVAPNLSATAVAPDGLVEGIEAREGWIVGVQWHPERMSAAHPEQLAVFEAFVAAAGRKVKSEV